MSNRQFPAFAGATEIGNIPLAAVAFQNQNSPAKSRARKPSGIRL
jgi:hypothetical protein